MGCGVGMVENEAAGWNQRHSDLKIEMMEKMKSGNRGGGFDLIWNGPRD